MLSLKDYQCRECKSTDTFFVAKLSKHKKPRLYVIVDCNMCGSFSHIYHKDEIIEAIERLIHERFYPV